jgi:hypothetical protein
MSNIKKRGRKKKDENIQIMIDEPIIDEPIVEPIHEVIRIVEPPIEPQALKKRGRKPKGGKLINKNMIEPEEQPASANVILHLKCSLKDIQGNQSQSSNDPLAYNPTAPPDIMTYENNKHNFSYYEGSLKPDTTPQVSVDHKLAYLDGLCKSCKCNVNDEKTNEDGSLVNESAEENNISLKDINSKLKNLRIQFYKNAMADKKSACFWCTYDYDNPSCYIPKYEMDDTICGYGSFCRPECAVGFLMKENIDDSTKFERYRLLNQIYSKVYDYKKNIKPAPNPHYLLEKFYGTLTIQEYRKLLKTEHMLLVIDKPLTRILPELHEDNDEFVLNIYGGLNNDDDKVSSKGSKTTTGVYKVKRQSDKSQGPTKNSIIKDKFGCC